MSWCSGCRARPRSPGWTEVDQVNDLDHARTPPWLVLTPVLVTVGFYAIVLLVVVVLCLVPLYLNSWHSHNASLIQGSWKSFALAGALLVAAWPRRERTFVPGFEIDEASQPRLFEWIRKITKAGKEAMPDKVYLTNDMNAAVAHVHNRFSVRQQRILILGLPLLQVLTVPEVAAVLAHEFGHFAGGHTRFGAWTYRMRQSMARVAGKAS